MIRTKAAYTTKEGICEGGIKRTDELLDRLGLTYDSWVSMQLIQRELGLSDTLFSFCKVKKGDEIEASKVLREYVRITSNAAYNMLVVADPTYQEHMVKPLKAIDKRVKSIIRREFTAQQFREVKDLYNKETRPHVRHWLNALLCLLSNQPLHLCATHASISIMDGADIVGVRKEAHDMLNKSLADLLGPE